MSDISNRYDSLEGIAMIGMAGCFPGAKNIQEFWANLKNGVDSISFFSERELAASGIDVASVKDDQNYIRARGILPDAELFDAAFFKINTKEAELMDPQHRLMLEYSWQALETAGYDPDTFEGAIGIYAGTSKNTYFLSNLYPNRHNIDAVNSYQAEMGNEKDYLTTRISYKLNLTGPSVSLHTACSTSLVAVFHACQSLLNYQCDMALAGGVSVKVPQKQGYWYEEGAIASPDGCCRAFDEQGQGTVFSNGVGVVVLKRMEDAVAAGDSIYAIIKGIAINNDGSTKVSFGAPSVDGQAEVIAMAQAVANVEPETISYVEGHGTATPLGDPIEVAALTQAFRAGTEVKGFCALGSVKSNIGHLDAAAGIAGLIKTALALKHKLLLPSLHFEKPNSKFDIENTPFYVNTKLTEWKVEKTPRRAGVSSFGTGGTNAHAVLEEAPPAKPSSASRSWQLLQLSTKTEAALKSATDNLIQYLKASPDCNLADVAYTLQVGRKGFPHRRILVCQDLNDAVNTLDTLDPKRVMTQFQERKQRTVAFMFPGQGSQYVNMGLELYQSEATFREQVDRCAEILKPVLGIDLRHVLYPSDAYSEEATRQLKETAITQPAIFVIEYALAQLWMKWGIQPQTMIGHSIGEFVAACLAGVFSLEDALALLAVRGRLMQDLPGGSMLAVSLPEQEILPLLNQHLSLAAINGPANCVVSGPKEAIKALEQQFAQREIASRHLHTSHAFHSAMMAPILEAFTAEVRKVRLNSPQIPFLSSPTGTWITLEQATDPAYWASHLRQTVRFADGRQELAKTSDLVLLEVGPGNTLTTLAKHPSFETPGQVVLSSLGHVLDDHQDTACLLKVLGKLWLEGVSVDWSGYYAHERRCRVPLPTYPFERKRYWIDPPKNSNYNGLTPDAIPDTSAEEQIAIHKVVEIVPVALNKKENSMAVANPSPTYNISRKACILAELKSTTYELSGLNPDAIDEQATFLELGFDSLFLTQASIAFKKQFQVKITFRQLLEDTPTPDALADYIDAQLPPEALPVETSPSAVTAPSPEASELLLPFPSVPQLSSANGTAPAAAPSNSALERVINQQLQLMAQQLEMLRNSGGTIAVPSPTEVQSIQEKVPPSGANEAKLKQPQNTVVAVTPAQTRGETEKLQRFGPWKPFDKSASQSLSPRQQKYLNDLIARYTARTEKSKQLTQTHRPHLADPRSASGFRSEWKEMIYPIVAVRSSGSKLWDIDGNDYIDVHSGFGSVFFGHSPEFVRQAVEEQLKKGVQIGPQSPLAGEVAKLICEFTGMERVTFCNTGSEAVLAALRVARTVTGRNKIATFTNDYHGMFDEVLVRLLSMGDRSRTVPIAPGIPPQMVENVLILEYGDPKSLEILKEHTDDLAAVLVEPVQSRHPDLQPRDFLHALREWTEKSEIILIFDEVVTGFRLHPGGAQAWFGIQADLATYGKIIGGGMPMGALAGKATFMDALDGGMWNYSDESFPEVGVTYFAGTFVRHPLALAAALAVLKHLQQSGPELHERLNEKAAQLAKDLNEHFESVRARIHLEQCASILLFKFLEAQEFSSLLFFYLREKGVYILEGGSFILTTAHTDEELTFVTQAIKESVAEMQAAGFLPGGLLDSTLGAEPKKQKGVELPSQDSTPHRFPLTEAQTEIWLALQMGKEASCAFNESFTLQLRGPFNVEHMRRAVQVVIARHEALHLRFSPEGDAQEKTTPVIMNVPLQDFSTLDGTAKDAKVVEILTKEASEPFDLINGPLLRVQILKLAQQEHLLIFSSHHIVCDGWSSGVLLDEISIIYSATCQGKPYQLPEPTPFSEYAIEQTKEQESVEVAEAYQYWADQFAETPPILELPTDRPRPPFKSYKGETVKWTFNPLVCQAIKRVAVEQHATLFAVLFAAYKLLLSRLSGQEDTVVGVSAAGQPITGRAKLVGHCVNLLPLRSRCDRDASFKDFLASTKIGILDAYDHYQCTFGGILRHLKLPRDASRLPLVEAIFNLDPDLTGHGFYELEASVAQAPKCAVNFDIFFNINESGDGLTADCHYNADLFDQETIRRWFGHYETLLEAIATNPNQSLSDLSLLSEAERDRVLGEWNQTQAEYPQDKCIYQLFEAQVERSPNAVAVVFEQQQLTYQQLNSRANKIGHYLRSLGVGSEVLVGICVERSLEMVVGLLGILKAGGAYVPLDPTYPKERLAFMLSDAQVSVLLTQQKLVAGLPEHKAQVVCLNTDWETIAQQPEENLAVVAGSDNLAYTLYTSGSTGRPKGVQISHQALTNFLCSMQREPGLTAKDVLLSVTTLSFDIAALELYLPLITGARVVVLSREVASDGVQLAKALDRFEATVMQATPGTWRMLLESRLQGRKYLKMLCGGEALSRGLAEQLLQKGGELWNMYGPTETTIWSAVCKLKPSDKVISIGRPIANTQLYLLDQKLQPVPVGVAGRLYIGGDGLTRGYLNQPELTSQKFISSPFSPDADALIYDTGDLARYLPDGRVECLGRIDYQVKIRGFRIELGEIEAVLVQHFEVREAVVIAREDVPGDKRLVAYVVPHQKPAPTVNQLRSFLKEKLPEYMLPSTFVMLEVLPLTPNGKVDCRALPVPDQIRHEPEETFVAPRDELELQLTKIWEQVLGHKPIGVRDNFFELGGHSLLAVRLFAQIEKVTHKNLPLAVLFQAPTIEQLVGILRREDWSPAWSSLVPIQPGGSKQPFFCVHGAGGHVLNYYSLARHLGSEQPFYGLQGQGLDGKQAFHTQIEDMAAYYVQEMRSLQPEGPYCLGGYCSGGLIAFEMAQQLYAQGQEVALLALFDTQNLAKVELTRSFSDKLYDFWREIEFLWGNLSLLKLKEKFTFLLERAKWGQRRIVTRIMARNSMLPLVSLRNIHDQAAMNYVPQVYPGRVTLFQSCGFKKDEVPQVSWEGLVAGGMDVHELPVYFRGMLVEPFVWLLAGQLRTCLAQVEEKI